MSGRAIFGEGVKEDLIALRLEIGSQTLELAVSLVANP